MPHHITIKFFRMEKYLSVPVTSLGNQLVSVAGVKLIDEATATSTTTTIHYIDGTVTTLTHDADTGYSMLLALQAAMNTALQTSWKDLVHPVKVPKAVSNIANANA